MKKQVIFVICCFSVCFSFAQEANKESIVIDSLYREDQFYIGLTYNLLVNKPNDINQSGFSGGLHAGFIRDMPINKQRNIALGLGLGYSLNIYNQNLFIGNKINTNPRIFESLQGLDYTTNKFITHLVEFPLEFRWRTSVPETHKFYRIYTGIKMGYLFDFRSKFEDLESQEKQKKVKELNFWRVGATFAFGWNTFNFYFYYSLNTLFDNDATLENRSIKMKPFKMGLIFYML